MLRLTNFYAVALLEYAEERNLELVYQQALEYLARPKDKVPDPLGSFLTLIPENDTVAAVNRFLKMAKEKISFLDTEIISAVPLTFEQLDGLQAKLTEAYAKPLNVVTTVDPSILGGLRIIVGNTVIDDSIKRKLFELKTSMIKGVREHDS